MKPAFVALFAGTVSCALIRLVPAAEAATFKEKILYSFGGLPDGEEPYDSVIDVNGTLYGTTFAGGSDYGTVFALDLNTGAEKVLYSFSDTESPEAGLIDVKGTLYGTTAGGDNGEGAVFSIDPNTDVEKTLYSFCSQPHCADGANPAAGLIHVNGKLYGTTPSGGAAAHGTVFSIGLKTGAENVLYSFCSQMNCTDGAFPVASLINVNGTLYGATEYGGGTGCSGLGCGTVFSIDPNTGAEKTLYTFCSQQNCADGATPRASLIDVNGMLYGTTEQGGGTGCGGFGCGTVFSIDPNTGAEKVLYSFLGGTDGAQPLARLLIVNGTLFGTTFEGGGTGCRGTGCGMVFSIDPNTGAETVLYSFLGGADGEYPQAGLIDVKATLYGTTEAGGSTGCGVGCGTVFALKKKH